VPTYLSPQEAADFLGISISTLYRWRVQRGLRTLRPFIGARPHFLHADLQAFMARTVEGSLEQSGVLANDVSRAR
jgi:excisionase family DNA binding protein